MPWLVNRYVVGFLAVVGLLVMTHLAAYRDGKDVVQTAWDRERGAQAVLLAAAEKRAREAERKLQESADVFQKDKRDEIARIDTQYRAIIDGLRQRPERPAVSEVPHAARLAESACQCTGARLYREDAEFLAREAARADAIRAELDACYRQYDQARQLTNN